MVTCCCQASSIQSHCRCFLVSDSLNKQWNTYSCKPACPSKTAFWKGRWMVSENTLMKLGSRGSIRANLGLRERVTWGHAWVFLQGMMRVVYWLFAGPICIAAYRVCRGFNLLDKGKRRILFPVIDRVTSVPFYFFFSQCCAVEL